MPRARGQFVDLTGKRFGKLTVLERAANLKGRATWLCRCDCGNTKTILTRYLKSGETKSCGCLKRGPRSGVHGIVNSGLLAEFEKHLTASGKAEITVRNRVRIIRRFLRFIGGEKELSRITDDTVREFFKQIPKGKTTNVLAMSVGQFLKFAVPHLPAVVTPETKPPPVIEDQGLIRMRESWQHDKLHQQKESGDDTIARLGRKLIDHYLYFQSRLRGGPESMEELGQLAADCQTLIQANLPLFLSLSASGRNIHTLVDERINHEGTSLDRQIRD